MSLKIGDIKTESGLKKLNEYLETRSYIEGYSPSQSDTLLFEAIAKSPDSKFVHLKRWFNQINSYGNERKQFSGVKKSLADYGVNADSKAADNDDDFELFGSDDEVDEEAEKAKQERVAAYQEKKIKEARTYR